MLQALTENQGANILAWQVDVRDVGKAHVLAAEVSACLCFFQPQMVQPSKLWGAQCLMLTVEHDNRGLGMVPAPQVPTASGRYILSHSHTLSSKFVCDTLAKRFPQYKFPAGEDQPSKQILDNSKARQTF